MGAGRAGGGRISAGGARPLLVERRRRRPPRRSGGRPWSVPPFPGRDRIGWRRLIPVHGWLLTVVDPADDGVVGVADMPGVRMPRPVGPGGALVGAVTWSSVQ